MRVSIIGTGYVGLVSGVCLAEKGHQVICVDVDQVKVEQISRGIPPLHEPGLEPLLRKNLGKRFRASTDLESAIEQTDLSIIAVGTPFHGREIDLRFVRQAARQIGLALARKTDYHVVVVKSTVVPGTTEDVVLPIIEQSSGMLAGAQFGLGMNPEFLREGCAVQDFLFPDRLVLGALDPTTAHVLDELYAPFQSVDRLRTSPRTAETIKYAANALLATMISFSNEIGNLCASIPDVDVLEVMRGVHLDKRLSPILADGQRITPAFVTYLEAGCGFGGSCFPKDLKALAAFGDRVGSPMRLLKSVLTVNRAQPLKVLGLLKKHFPELHGVRVSVLGLAFKPGTDDVRDSPAIPVIRQLVAEGATVTAYDPIVRRSSGPFAGLSIAHVGTLTAALEDADAVLVLTRWPEFQQIPELLQERNPPPVVIDGRRMLDPTKLQRYEGIGLRKDPLFSPAHLIEPLPCAFERSDVGELTHG